MVKCYAASFGNCSNKQSKEHYISKGIWRTEQITFDGFSWAKDEARTLPVKAVSQKILCTKHNSNLSPLDGFAQEFFDVGAKFHNNQYERGQLKRSAIWKPDRITIDGHKLERLLTKMAIGVLSEERSTTWHLTQTTFLEPPRDILEALFGLRQLIAPMGLYFVNVVGDKIKNEDRVTIQTMLHPETGGYIGSIVAIRHWQFLINLSDIDPAEHNFESVSGKMVGKDGSPAVYRIETINLNASGKLSGRISFDWGNSSEQSTT